MVDEAVREPFLVVENRLMIKLQHLTFIVEVFKCKTTSGDIAMLLIIGHNSLQIVLNKVDYELIVREKRVYVQFMK